MSTGNLKNAGLVEKFYVEDSGIVIESGVRKFKLTWPSWKRR